MGEKQIMKRDERYLAWVKELKARYQRSQIKASISVNSEMLAFYWSIGRDIVEMQAENTYGSSFYKTLSADLKKELPGAKGFSQNNLRYMRHYYNLFSNQGNLPQLVGDSRMGGDSDNLPQAVGDFEAEATLANRPQVVDDFDALPNMPQVAAELFCVPWGHIRTIIDKCKGDRAKAEFYVRKTVENNWSRAVLLNFLGPSRFLVGSTGGQLGEV